MGCRFDDHLPPSSPFGYCYVELLQIVPMKPCEVLKLAIDLRLSAESLAERYRRRV